MTSDCKLCGHEVEDHATGTHRWFWFCEHGDCDCQDYVGPARQTLRLSDRDRDTLLDALGKDAEPNGALADAAARYKRVIS